MIQNENNLLKDTIKKQNDIIATHIHTTNQLDEANKVINYQKKEIAELIHNNNLNQANKNKIFQLETNINYLNQIIKQKDVEINEIYDKEGRYIKAEYILKKLYNYQDLIEDNKVNNLLIQLNQEVININNNIELRKLNYSKLEYDDINKGKILKQLEMLINDKITYKQDYIKKLSFYHWRRLLQSIQLNKQYIIFKKYRLITLYQCLIHWLCLSQIKSSKKKNKKIKVSLYKLLSNKRNRQIKSSGLLSSSAYYIVSFNNQYKFTTFKLHQQSLIFKKYFKLWLQIFYKKRTYKNNKLIYFIRHKVNNKIASYWNLWKISIYQDIIQLDQYAHQQLYQKYNFVIQKFIKSRNRSIKLLNQYILVNNKSILFKYFIKLKVYQQIQQYQQNLHVQVHQLEIIKEQNEQKLKEQLVKLEL